IAKPKYKDGGSHASLACLRDYHFSCDRNGRLLVASPSGSGHTAATAAKVSERPNSIHFARCPDRGSPLDRGLYFAGRALMRITQRYAVVLGWGFSCSGLSP